METFDFYIDTKVTTWMRTKFEIKSDSEEESKQLAIEFIQKGYDSDISWDEVMDTQEIMSVEENDNQPTKELFNQSGNCIWDNTKTN